MSETPVETKLGEDGILEIRLQSNTQNSMTPAAFAALDQAITEYSTNSAVRSVVLASNKEGFFCAGLDIDGVLKASESELDAVFQYFFSVLKKLYFFPVPVTAAINGHAMGYGAMLASVSDYRYVVEKGARVSFPEVNIGIGLPVFVTRIVQDLVGVVNTRDLFLTGRALKAPEAAAMGLVDEVLAPDQLEAKARANAKRIAGLSASAVRSLKESMRARHAADADAIIAADIKSTMGNLDSPDAKEGFSAVVEKRRPKFS